MKRLLGLGLALLCAFTLAACQTAGGAKLPDTSALPSATQVDAKVAAVSQQLAQQCATLQTVLILANALDTKDKYKKAIDAASAARTAYCNSAPPSDVNTAALAIASMAIAVNEAIKAEKKANVSSTVSGTSAGTS